MILCSIHMHAADNREEMQPDPEVSRKMLHWIEKLGLDKVLINIQVLQ